MTRCPHRQRPTDCPTCSCRVLLTGLALTVGHLTDSVMPGTSRPWRAPQMSAAKRAELDRQDREDRLHIAQQGNLPAHLRGQAVVVPPGESPAPYDLDISDLLSTILGEVDKLAALVPPCPPLLPPAPAASAFTDPGPFLTHLDLALDRLDRDLLEHIADRCYRLTEQAGSHLGEVTDGQLLAGLCPWCDGKTSSHPVGGARTLRVRTMTTGRTVVVCEGGQCAPDAAECGIWLPGGRPAWDLENEGAWLSDRIERATASRTEQVTVPAA